MSQVNPFRWAEIGWPTQTERYVCLSEYMNERGHPNTFESMNVEPSQFDATLDLALKQFDLIRVGSPYGEASVSKFTHLPALMMTLKSCDTLVKRNQIWWPDNLLYQALQTLLAEQQTDLDFSSSVLIVGAGASARATVAAVLRMGFYKINVTDQFDERGTQLVLDLKKAYFNAQFQFTPQSVLTSLPGIHSLVINATPLSAANEILNQLYYFNFMQANGLVIDYTMVPQQTPLAKEALGVGGRVINGVQVASYVDQLWAEQHLGYELNRQEYEERLSSCLAKVPFELPPETDVE